MITNEDSDLGKPPENLALLDSTDAEGYSSYVESDSDMERVDLSYTIISELQRGTYTCLVCTSEIDAYSKIWSCEFCYRVYDLDCISDWASRGSSTDENKNWRCPSCNELTKQIPSEFGCWCGKVLDPDPNILNPFSCGNTCDSKYNDCIHKCSSICHPGKHPICSALGPSIPCRCGKERKQVPCLITPYKDGWTCRNPCKDMVCDDHNCTIGKCHSGLCGPCEETVTGKCYCGTEETQISCSDRLPAVSTNKTESWVGVYQCANKITIQYDCGVHSKNLPCHPLVSEVPKCELASDKISTCYCGKNKIKDLLGKEREKCTDPIPECESVCGKLLNCGCTCKLKCHEGECYCYNILEAKCQCQSHTYLVPCAFLQAGHKPRCDKRCPALLNCRRHYHNEVCCEFESVAMRRERERKKMIRKKVVHSSEDDIMQIEPVHICTKVCNRLRSCRIHYCDALCHYGPCKPCLESSSEDLVCPCGSTVIPAPVRCGTVLNCTNPCNRPKSCGHRPEYHICHGDNVNCPRCTKVVSRPCSCGQKVIPNVQCSQAVVSCGVSCGAKKACSHPCMKICSAECSQGLHSVACSTVCRKVRSSCPHLCKQKCHYGNKSVICDSFVCKESVTLFCACKRIVKQVDCGASKDGESIIGTVLSCDDECATHLRNKRLMEALDISHTKSKNSHNPYPDSLMNTFMKQKTWCLKVEAIIRDFCSNNINKRSHHFPIMRKPQRYFIHQLAEVYGLYSESQDPEPNRSVFVALQPLTKIPNMSLEEASKLPSETGNTVAEAAVQVSVEKATFNALVIESVFFGITQEELLNVLEPIIMKSKLDSPTLKWFNESTYIFYPADFDSYSKTVETLLFLLCKSFRNVLRNKSIAFDCKLCEIDKEAKSIIKVEQTFSNSASSKVGNEVKYRSNNKYDVLMKDTVTETPGSFTKKTEADTAETVTKQAYDRTSDNDLAKAIENWTVQDNSLVD